MPFHKFTNYSFGLDEGKKCCSPKLNIYLIWVAWHAMNSEHALAQHSNPYKVSWLSLFSDLMKCSVSMEACLCSTSMFCKREYQIGTLRT